VEFILNFLAVMEFDFGATQVLNVKRLPD